MSDCLIPFRRWLGVTGSGRVAEERGVRVLALGWGGGDPHPSHAEDPVRAWAVGFLAQGETCTGFSLSLCSSPVSPAVGEGT